MIQKKIFDLKNIHVLKSFIKPSRSLKKTKIFLPSEITFVRVFDCINCESAIISNSPK